MHYSCKLSSLLFVVKALNLHHTYFFSETAQIASEPNSSSFSMAISQSVDDLPKWAT